jgi:hypothetical protein
MNSFLDYAKAKVDGAEEALKEPGKLTAEILREN